MKQNRLRFPSSRVTPESKYFSFLLQSNGLKKQLVFRVGHCFSQGIFALALRILICRGVSPCRQLSLFLPCCLPGCCGYSNLLLHCGAVLHLFGNHQDSVQGLCRVSCSLAASHRKRLAISDSEESSDELLHCWCFPSKSCWLVFWGGACLYCYAVCGSWEFIGEGGGDIQGFHPPLLPIHCAIPVAS